MTCAVRGCPTPRVSWYLDNVCINSDNNYYITNSFGVCSLYILSVRAKDGGEYKVVAVNPLGKAECSTKLVVKGKINERYSFWFAFFEMLVLVRSWTFFFNAPTLHRVDWADSNTQQEVGYRLVVNPYQVVLILIYLIYLKRDWFMRPFPCRQTLKQRACSKNDVANRNTKVSVEF